jgi:hypothetical protein
VVIAATAAWAVLDGRHQAEMPGRHRQLVVSRDCAQHRHADDLTGLAQHLLVTR